MQLPYIYETPLTWTKSVPDGYGSEFCERVYERTTLIVVHLFELEETRTAELCLLAKGFENGKILALSCLQLKVGRKGAIRQSRDAFQMSLYYCLSKAASSAAC